MSDPNQWLLAMGFRPGRSRVFVGAARFVVGDMEEALRNVARGRTYTIPVDVEIGEVVQVALSHVEKANDIPDWSFDGVVEDATSRFNGVKFHGYAYGTDDDGIGDVHIQLYPSDGQPAIK